MSVMYFPKLKKEELKVLDVCMIVVCFETLITKKILRKSQQVASRLICLSHNKNKARKIINAYLLCFVFLRQGLSVLAVPELAK